MTSLNIIITAINQVELQSQPVPNPGHGEVTVRATKSLISTGTEGIILGGLFAQGTHWAEYGKYPHTPGYSLVGRIEAVGEGVEDWAVGDRVTVRKPHKQLVTLPVEMLYRIPEGVSDEDAAWTTLAGIVQVGIRRADHVLGDCVAVIGLGLLGQLAVQYLRLMGAREIIAIDTAEKRLEMARQHGATSTLAITAEQAKEGVLQLSDGNGADVVYDITGNSSILPHALGMAKRFGKVIILGDAGNPSEQRLTPDVIRRGVTIIGAHIIYPPAESTDHYHWNHPEMAKLFFNYLERGDMRVSDMVTHHFSPLEAPEAYRLLTEQRSTAMGVMFDWDSI